MVTYPDRPRCLALPALGTRESSLHVKGQAEVKTEVKTEVKMMKSSVRRLLAGMLCGGAAVLIGCAHGYQNRPAPEMASTSDRWVDYADNYAYMRNTNQRSFLDDVNRALYLDNPSRLSPYPIVDQSGNPR